MDSRNIRNLVKVVQFRDLYPTFIDNNYRVIDNSMLALYYSYNTAIQSQNMVGAAETLVTEFFFLLDTGGSSSIYG